LKNYLLGYRYFNEEAATEIYERIRSKAENITFRFGNNPDSSLDYEPDVLSISPQEDTDSQLSNLLNNFVEPKLFEESQQNTTETFSEMNVEESQVQKLISQEEKFDKKYKYQGYSDEWKLIASLMHYGDILTLDDVGTLVKCAPCSVSKWRLKLQKNPKYMDNRQRTLIIQLKNCYGNILNCRMNWIEIKHLNEYAVKRKNCIYQEQNL
jgi:hypothetical protein